MPDVIHEQYGPLAVHHAKTEIERHAVSAYRAGLSPNEACPHPFHSQSGLHWLAAYNLSIPLTARLRNATQKSTSPQ